MSMSLVKGSDDGGSGALEIRGLAQVDRVPTSLAKVVGLCQLRATAHFAATTCFLSKLRLMHRCTLAAMTFFVLRLGLALLLQTLQG